MREVASGSRPSDRAAVARAARDLVLGVAQQHAPGGASIVIEGAPGIGKTFLAREILDSVAPEAAKVVVASGKRGRRTDPFAMTEQLLGGTAPPGDPAEAAFDHIDELCAEGPVVLWVDDAHNLDAGSLTLLRRLVWACLSLPLAVLVTTRPSPSREQLTTLLRQAQTRLVLPPMGPMLAERMVFERTGRWPGPLLRRILGLAAGNPLFVGELLGAYEKADALAAAGPDSIEAKFELGLRATGLDGVIRAQIEHLDEPILQLLAAMAVWGTDAGADDLAAMLPGSADALGELIEQAISSGLVRREPPGTVGFAHDLFREVTYRGLPEARRRETHRRAAQVLAAAGYRPTLVADHLLRAATDDADPALVTALQEAVAATRGYAPEVTADLLDNVAAVSGSDVPEPMLLDHAQALFLRGRSEAAETLIRQRIATITDPTVALQMQVVMIRSLMNRGDVAAALAAIEQTADIAGLPEAALRQLETTRAWLLALAGRIQPAAELDAMMARFVSAGDRAAQASVLATSATAAFLSGRPDAALEYLRVRDEIRLDPDAFRYRSSMLVLPALFELASSGPQAAKAAIDPDAAAERGKGRQLGRPHPRIRRRGNRVRRRRLGRRRSRTGRGSGARGGDEHRLDLTPGRHALLHRCSSRRHRAGARPAGVIPAPRPAAPVRARPPRPGRAGGAGGRGVHPRGGHVGQDAVVSDPEPSGPLGRRARTRRDQGRARRHGPAARRPGWR
jgi:hypothetical protein